MKVLLKNSSENLAQVTENSIKGIMNKWFSLFFLKFSWFYLYLKKIFVNKNNQTLIDYFKFIYMLSNTENTITYLNRE